MGHFLLYLISSFTALLCLSTSSCSTVEQPINTFNYVSDNVRIYTEREDLGHVFVSVGLEENMVIYTYGPYYGFNEENPSLFDRLFTDVAPGILVRLKGAAKRLINTTLHLTIVPPKLLKLL